ncbi:MAG: 3-phosphoshikimate 1-carboxyvinyltransferase [Flavobacteriia bacterium]
MITIKPFKVQHVIHSNASKSDAQRCLLLASLAHIPTKIYGLDHSEDISAMLNCIQELGAKYDADSFTVYPTSILQKESITLNVQESGFALRTLAFVGMAFTKNLTLNGTGSLLQRDHSQVCHILQQIGFTVESNGNKLPIHISGSAKGKKLTVNGEAGSQAISGLFLLAPFLNEDSVVSIEALKSKPYLEMTINRMRDFGLLVDELTADTFHMKGEQKIKSTEVQIEGDWSGASNPIVGAAISGKVELHGLNPQTLQADRQILQAIGDFGATITWENDVLLVHESKTKTPFETNITDCPDLFPILVVLACAATGTSKIIGINRLKNKESDRLAVMCEVLEKFRIAFQLDENTICIHGTGMVEGGEINTHNDHRIAMAATIASCIARNSIQLTDASCVAKSYPEFFNDLRL